MHANKIFTACLVLPVVLCLFVSCGEKTKNNTQTDGVPTKPNIVIIYLDDLGYGDVGAYGATQLKTPNMDRLASGGVRFTNGYAASATCSPSRYALLTGSYPWRNERAKILSGTAPLLIRDDQPTIPKMLKTQGYTTGIVGKWHIGLGNGQVDWNKRIAPGPNEVGFDYAYIMAATQDRVPTVYIENGHVVRLDPTDPIQVDYKNNFPGEPTGKLNPEMLKTKWHHGHFHSIINGISRIGYMKGGDEAKWVDENMADTFLVKAQDFVKRKKSEPFFLYYALQQPHVPRTPHQRFAGSSGLGPRGDVIVEADWCIGEFMKTLESHGLLENTLVVLSSDNGPVLNDGYYDEAVEKNGSHTPAGGLRGGKYSLFEAGTRVPFITYWSGKIEPSTSDAVVSQIDLFSSLASLVNGESAGEDSQNLLDVLLGVSSQGREELILEATSRTAYRQGDWVMIPPYAGPAKNEHVNIELGNDPDFQLYNLASDLPQQANLAISEPEILKEMLAAFEKIRGAQYGKIEQLQLE
ncbi:MAG: arylsulfatase [Saprospiraceae bacterium]|nr:arylsulfatase [Saprospiraceae bacterium]